MRDPKHVPGSGVIRTVSLSALHTPPDKALIHQDQGCGEAVLAWRSDWTLAALSNRWGRKPQRGF